MTVGMVDALGRIGSRAIAVLMAFVLAAVIIRVGFLVSPAEIHNFQGFLDSLTFPILTYIATVYGLKEGSKAYQNVQEKKIEATKPKGEEVAA